MKLTVNFADGVINLPRSVANNIKSATRDDIAALIALLSDPRVCVADVDDDVIADISAAAGLTKQSLLASLSFWRGAGVISIDGAPSALPATTSPAAAAAPSAEAARTKKPAPRRELPELTGQEAEAMIAASPERRSLLNECQQTIGHIFDNNESALILSMREYLGLEDEYILLLLAYCARIGKKNVRYAEKVAFSFYERGIDTSEALVEELTWREASRSDESRLHTLFGHNLTKKEQEYFERWSREFGYGYDMMEAAYEATVNAIGKHSAPYMNKVLESWHGLGYKTPEDVDTTKKRRAELYGDSFDVDDFFRLAVLRGEQDDETDKKIKEG